MKKKPKAKKPARIRQHYARLIIDIPCNEPTNRVDHLTMWDCRYKVDHNVRPIYTWSSPIMPSLVSSGPSTIELSGTIRQALMRHEKKISKIR